MRIDESNKIYLFKDNEKMDCIENIIASAFLEDIDDLLSWFISSSEKIKEKYFIQYLYDDGSIIRAHSGKDGYVKYVRLWKFDSVYEHSGEVILNFSYSNKSGLGNKSIKLAEFIGILLDSNIQKGNFFQIFRPHGNSQHPDYPKEPNVIITGRKALNDAKRIELVNKIPCFSLESAKLVPHKLTIDTDKSSTSHLITKKFELLDWMKLSFSKLFSIDNCDCHYLSVDFKTDDSSLNNKRILLLRGITSHNISKLKMDLDLYLDECSVSGVKEISSSEELVDFIFNITLRDKDYLVSEFRIKEVTEKVKLVKKLETKPSILMRDNLAELDEIKSHLKMPLNSVIRFELDNYWLETAPISTDTLCFNFFYPEAEEPIAFFADHKILIPSAFELSHWESNTFCTFDCSFNDDFVDEAAVFIDQIFTHLFDRKAVKMFDVSIEVIDDGVGVTEYASDMIDIYHDAGIGADFSHFSGSEEFKQLEIISESQLFKDVEGLYKKLEKINQEGSFSRISPEHLKEKLKLLKEYFYKNCLLYSDNKILLQIYQENDCASDSDGTCFNAWYYEPVKKHFDAWEIDEYKKMSEHVRRIFNRPDAFLYLDKRLENLKKVIQQVKKEPGIERKSLYVALDLNARSYSSIITTVLVDNGIIMEEQQKSKRRLYPL
ncbi:hypothetical protein SAMN06297280_3411 [Arsukibacterium tuosuense]|uniref:Uncharacterized protein n=1 Tax=Arsukibacterium tuosuense TaxID=1323745 RepID=A0A285JE02_9GAMM|nr:hypothetical protein [Arsukibacterium tuosuense]SNY58465.1 hypothetical protein SAMN06297280_3411 [Arsukibacterium tuosuense]